MTRAPATLALEPETRIDWVELGPGRFAARASAPVTIAAEVRLEEKTPAGTFAPVTLDRALRLANPGVASSAGADCTALRGGEALALEGWDGSACAGARCLEAGADPIHAGAHRWVISGCSSSARWESPEFTLLTQLLADRGIWINYAPSIRNYAETNFVGGKEIGIGPIAYRWGRWTVLATLIHELAHSNGAPDGASKAAEEAVLHCGLGRLSEKQTGVDDYQTPYDPEIGG